MLRNYLRIAFRTMLRHKGYAALNIAGLAVGLACAFFITLWIQDELSTDRFHEDGDRIYSVMRHSTFSGVKGTTESIPKPLAQALLDEYPEVENTVLWSWDTWMLLNHEQERMRINGRWAGPDFFEVFSFPLLVGNPQTALDAPDSIVLTESVAARFFGTDWRSREVLGQVITVNNRIDMTVTGVAADPPSTTQLNFNFVIPIEEFVSRNQWVEQWDNNGLRMFARLRAGTDLEAFNAKIIGMIDQRVDSYQTDLFFYPVSRKYLHNDWESGVQVGGRIEYVRAFGLVGLLIILIASINFMNLATARSSARAREIGVRKTIGATRESLATQFMGESLLKAALAFLIATLLVAAFMSSFNELTGKSVSLASLGSNMVLFLVIALGTGLLAGTYPAIYLSAFSVTSVFRKQSATTGGGAALRKGLVVTQFAMSIVLIVGTLTVYRQLDYIRTKDLGLDRENVAMVRLEGAMQDQFETFKNELLQVDGVVAVSTSNINPMNIGNDTIGVEWDGKDPENNTLFWNGNVGYDFTKTLGITIAQGRDFAPEYGSDTTNYIINWQAAEAMDMENPVGQEIVFWDRPGTIVGVMEDFHMESMYNPIRPVIFRHRPETFGQMYVRISGDRTQQALAGLERLYAQFNPDYLLNVRFMDEEFDESYRSEAVLGSLSNVFALVAIFIACLGLFGLASFTAEQRGKEIGIRKVLGASVPQMALLLSREFLLLVGAAFVIAAPIAYLVMNNWLAEFQYRVEMGLGILAAAGVATLLIAWLTVSYQSIRCALMDPVATLRSE
ncbi:MAG: ABC transporter permease [Rhodothermales bacterium]|nr:ABC transporter permease [Rhodothermales bacterium]MBO6780825.1 ABC transporter permease [Rhodothermales bacterium]